MQTDGSIYTDRKYKMVNFVTAIPKLAAEVKDIIVQLGFPCHLYVSENKNYQIKYTVRVSKNTENFINLISLYKN